MDQYPPVWLMMMKLRSVMGKRDSMYQLADEVELDEAFFPIRVPDEERDEPLKRGAGSQKKAKVLVIVESKPVDKILENYLHRKNTETMDKVASLAKASNRHTSGLTFNAVDIGWKDVLMIVKTSWECRGIK